MPEIVTEEPEFELDDIDTKILPPRPQYRKDKHEDEQFNKFVDLVRRLSLCDLLCSKDHFVISVQV